MLPLKSSKVEYQGIKIIKKEYPVLQDLLTKYFPDEKLKLKVNPHVCISYFGIKKRVDSVIRKEKQLFPYNALGLQVKCECTGIGAYYKDGKLMNVALTINDDIYYETKVNDKMLAEYENSGMPWITLYVCNDTIAQDDQKTHPITSCKKSTKCFDETKLEAGETLKIIPLDTPISIVGELCVFTKNRPGYRIESDAPRLVTRSAVDNIMNDLDETDFETKAKELREIEKTEKEKSAAEKIFG